MRISDRYKSSRTYRNTASTVLCCSDDWISCATCVLLLTYNHRSSAIATEPHLFHTVCLHYQIPVWVFWKEFCSCWPYHYDCVTNGHGVCPILIPFFMYLRQMAKFRSKVVACYTCSKACQKSCITTKCHILWAKLNHKNHHKFVYVLEI